MKFILLTLLSLLVACSDSGNFSGLNEGDELWVMIKTDTYFRKQNELDIVDAVSEVIESKKLGHLDGHSSGGFQFDFNFIEVGDWKKAKYEVEKTIAKSYPNIEYTISSTYETTYDKL